MVETRAIKGPRSYDSSGMPFHRDGQTVIKERIYLDKANGDVVHDEITTIDHALTRPWTVTRSYHRVQKEIWIEINCAEDNHQVRIGGERYYVSGDGYLMPTRRTSRRRICRPSIGRGSNHEPASGCHPGFVSP